MTDKGLLKRAARPALMRTPTMSVGSLATGVYVSAERRFFR